MASEIGNALLYVGGFLLVAAVSYLAILRILRPNKRTKLLLILPLSERNGDVTEELYAQHIRLQILGLRGQSCLIALDAGMNDHLAKPVEAKKMTSTIAKYRRK